MLGVVQRIGVVAGTKTEQQLLHAPIAESQIQCRQVLRLGLLDDFHRSLVGIAEETVIQPGVDVVRAFERFGFGEQRHHFFAHLRMLAQQLQVLQAGLTVDPQSLGVFRQQGLGRRQYRALVDMHQFDRYRRLSGCQIFPAGIQPFAQFIGAQRQ